MFACLQTWQPLPAEPWAPQTPKLGASGTPKAGKQPAPLCWAQAAFKTAFGGIFATTKRAPGSSSCFTPSKKGLQDAQSPRAGPAAPHLTHASPSPAAVICRRNRGAGRCGRRKAVHPAAPSPQVGQGRAAPLLCPHPGHSAWGCRQNPPSCCLSPLPAPELLSTGNIALLIPTRGITPRATVPSGPPAASQNQHRMLQIPTQLRDEELSPSGSSQKRYPPASAVPCLHAGAARRSCLYILHGVPCLPGRRGISTERGAGDVVPNRESQAPGMAINLQKAQLKFHSNYLIPLPIIPENILAVLGDLGRGRERIDCILINNG